MTTEGWCLTCVLLAGTDHSCEQPDICPCPSHADDLPDPGADRPGWVHRNARDTEREAAEMITPRSGTWRLRVLEAVAAAGDAGRTDWELHEQLGGNLYTVAPRRVELEAEGWIRDSGARRQTNNGRRAIVWVLSERGRQQLGSRVG